MMCSAVLAHNYRNRDIANDRILDPEELEPLNLEAEGISHHTRYKGEEMEAI